MTRSIIWGDMRMPVPQPKAARAEKPLVDPTGEADAANLPNLISDLEDVIRWMLWKDPLATNVIYVRQAIDQLRRNA